MNYRIKTTNITFLTFFAFSLSSLAVGYAENLVRKLPTMKKERHLEGFRIYCFEPKTNWPALKSFSSLYVKIEPSAKEYVPMLYFGQNYSEVEGQQKEKGLLGDFRAIAIWPQLRIRMSPLKESCLGVDSEMEYTLEGKMRAFDLLYVGMFIAGVIVFCCAPMFSRSVFFHYSSGVAIGVLASLLIIIYILSRFIPKKIGAVTFLIGGWSIVLYYIQRLADNALQSKYREYIALYFVIAGVISFAVCYWYGPVENERTMHILQYSLHTVGLLLIFSSVQHKPTAIAFIVILISITYFSGSNALRPWWPFSGLRRWWRRWNYPPVRLLSMEEYEEQGRIETEKALNELREYCNSPECNPWKMMSRVKSPERFSKFVLGEDHVSDEELTLYESDMSIPPDSLLTSDDSDDSNE